MFGIHKRSTAKTESGQADTVKESVKDWDSEMENDTAMHALRDVLQQCAVETEYADDRKSCRLTVRTEISTSEPIEPKVFIGFIGDINEINSFLGIYGCVYCVTPLMIDASGPVIRGTAHITKLEN